MPKSVLEAARKHKPNHGGMRCRLCSYPPNSDIDPPTPLEALDLLLRKVRGGELDLQQTNMVKILNECYEGLNVSQTTLGRHIHSDGARHR